MRTCIHEWLLHACANMNLNWPTSSLMQKQKQIYVSGSIFGCKNIARISPPEDTMSCETTLRTTPWKNSCPWRFKTEPDKEWTKLRRGKKTKKKECWKISRGANKEQKKQQTGKEKEMEKSSLSGFGNSDSWGPFVLITAEQRFCRY